MTSPLTRTGFVAPTVDEEVTDLNAKFLANIDAGLDLAPDQPIGQLIGGFAEKLAEAYEVIATVYNAINPAAAEGALLANACAMSGTLPQVATYSTVVATLTLGATTTVTAGAVAAVLNQPGNTWVLTASVTSTTAGAYPATFRSSVPGPFAANAGTLTVIGTPTIGWTAVTNAADAVPGLAADTDTTLRQKRLAELAGQGSGDTDAIRAVVLKVPGVLQAFVFENTSLVTDAAGLPGKAFRVVVWDGVGMSASNAALATAIWKAKPTGIQPFGSTSVNILDSAGNPQTVSFSRATQLRLYVRCTTTPSTLAAADTAAVKAAIKAYADTTFNLGVSVIARAFSATPLEPTASYTPPVTDVPVFQFDVTASPTNTANISVNGLSIVTPASGDILVNGV